MRRQWELIFLGLLLALTFYLASGYSLTTANFSVIGNQGGRRPAFLLWGALTGNYFYLYTDGSFGSFAAGAALFCRNYMYPLVH